MRGFFDWLLGEDEPPGERRRSPRYPAVPNRALLMWRDGGRTVVSTARLSDLSSVGTLLFADEVPPRGQLAWIRLEKPSPAAWVKAKVVRRAGGRKVGLDFTEHCPYDFFKLATQETERRHAVPPEFADGYWR
jgi:hypothetical protein